jgi:hypothetical protein
MMMATLFLLMFEFENGMVFPGYNDIGIPGNTGTRFSMTDDLSSDTAYYYRLRGGVVLNTRHHLTMLYSPLLVKSHGTIAKDVSFNGETFAAGTQLNGKFKFNSYRMTYRYDLVSGDRLTAGLGLTLKVRDAYVSIEGGGKKAKKTNLGAVPLINFHVGYRVLPHFSVYCEGDALAAPQGRAEDIFAGAVYDVTDHLSVFGGYRMLEGGSDNDIVYTFSMFNYAAAGVRAVF